MCDAHICVSHEMSLWLTRHLGLPQVSVLYDRPPSAVFKDLFIQPAAAREDTAAKTRQLERRHALLLKLGLTDSALFPQLYSRQRLLSGSRTTNRTVLTEEAAKPGAGTGRGQVQSRTDRAAFLVSSTSWTPDEDFTILGTASSNLYCIHTLWPFHHSINLTIG